MKEVTIYTDGACSGNPGPGGWGAILIYGKSKKEISGGDPDTTNNRMEMKAVIEALSILKEKCLVNLHSDSSYVINAFKQDWIANWQKNGWKTANKKDVANKDLWIELVELSNRHKVRWIKVKGHSTDEMNNRADELAVKESKKVGN